MLRSGIAHILMLEVILDALRLFLNAAQSAYSGSCESLSGSGGSGRGDSLLEIGVEQFVRIQFRRIAGQIKDLDLVVVLLPSALDQLGVVNPQVVQDQKYLPLWQARQQIGRG